jgi:hypothetical protein
MKLISLLFFDFDSEVSDLHHKSLSKIISRRLSRIFDAFCDSDASFTWSFKGTASKTREIRFELSLSVP